MKKVKMMKKYAKLIADVGIGANPKQDVCIKAPAEAYQFVRYLVLELYNSKARNVEVDFVDSAITKQTLMHLSPSRLDNIPDWYVAREKERTDKNYAMIHLVGEDPAAFKAVAPERLSRYSRALTEKTNPFLKIYMGNELAWCVAAVPTKAWAERIFPELSPTQAQLKLWKSIYQACYVEEDNDPEEAWNKHMDELKKHKATLNSYHFSALHYTNKLGTDLTVGLVKNHIWAAAQSIQTRSGMTFVPNIPTEEVFTMPDRTRIDGVVYSSKPLSYNGVIIDKFNITFKNGKAVAFHAEQGEDKLAEIINFDENSCSLGEAALVPFDSPISKQNIVYQSSLFDENASCHLALGASYKENIEGGETMTDEQVFSKGGNQSKVHVDFMIGTADTSIDGIREDGAIIPIFRNGNFVF
jgi:aminopeptidase